MSRRRRWVLVWAFIAVVTGFGAFRTAMAEIEEARRSDEPDAAWLVATSDIAAFEEVTSEVTGVRAVPDEWVPSQALSPDAALAGLVAVDDIPAGSLIQEGMVRPPITSNDRRRQVAVPMPAGGLQLEKGQLVDLYAGFSRLRRTCSVLVVSNAVVVRVDKPRGISDLDPVGGRSLTLSVNRRFAARLVYASFEGEVRVVAIPPGAVSDARPTTGCGVPAPYKRGKERRRHEPTRPAKAKEEMKALNKARPSREEGRKRGQGRARGDGDKRDGHKHRSGRENRRAR